MNSDTATHPYAALTPDRVLDAVDATGHVASGSLLALNSYENRVYQIGLESGDFLVAKFYRPNRLSDDAILAEHAFAREIAEHELPLVTPLADAAGRTLHHHQGFRLALYPRVGGRYPNLEDPEVLFRTGRILGRIHRIGGAPGDADSFSHRGRLEQVRSPREATCFLQQAGFIPPEHRQSYADLTERLLDRIEAALAMPGLRWIRLHGDFHPGNLLQRDEQLRILDTDDCCLGPAVQDLWLMLWGDRARMQAQLAELIEGYEEFYEFDRRELALIEPLRTLRILHYAAWLGRRWEDPAFPMHFPWFNQGPYWDEHIHTLREQLRVIDEPALTLG